MPYNVRNAMHEGKTFPQTYFVVYMYDLCLLDAAGDNGRYNENTNEFIVLPLTPFKLDVHMSSPPHTPPRKNYQGALTEPSNIYILYNFFKYGCCRN